MSVKKCGNDDEWDEEWDEWGWSSPSQQLFQQQVHDQAHPAAMNRKILILYI